eukprot:jgi/Chrzof1/7195/Cz02g14110.t1
MLLHADHNTLKAWKAVMYRWAAEHNTTGSLNSLSKAGDASGVQQLLDIAVEADLACQAALLIAAQLGHTAVVQALLSKGRNKQAGPTNLLQAAFEQGLANSVELLLEFGVHHWPLCAAARHGHTAVVQLLLDQAPGAQQQRDIALLVAASCGHIATATVLLDKGGNIHASHQAAFSLAVQNGHADMVQLLLQRGASVCQLKRHIRHPLAAAVKSKSTAMVQALLIHGRGAFDSSELDNAFKVALQNGQLDMLRLLMDAGVSVAGNTGLLHAAVMSGNKDACQLMIDRGAAQHMLQLMRGMDSMGTLQELLRNNNITGEESVL